LCIADVYRASGDLGGFVKTPRRRRVISELPVPQRESNMRRGDVMLKMENIKVQFIAGLWSDRP
jgi:hypothetical protein